MLLLVAVKLLQLPSLPGMLCPQRPDLGFHGLPDPFFCSLLLHDLPLCFPLVEGLWALLAELGSEGVEGCGAFSFHRLDFPTLLALEALALVLLRSAELLLLLRSELPQQFSLHPLLLPALLLRLPLVLPRLVLVEEGVLQLLPWVVGEGDAESGGGGAHWDGGQRGGVKGEGAG